MPQHLGTHLRHLIVEGTAVPEPYTYPREVRGGAKIDLPRRDRALQAQRLLDALKAVHLGIAELSAQRQAVGISVDRGVVLEFASAPGFELSLRSLDRSNKGDRPIELLSTRESDGRMLATVLVPEGRLFQLTDLVEKYRTRDDPRSGRPKNYLLVDSVSDIRRAIIDSFWTDASDQFPAAGEAIWWEVWMRVGNDREAVVSDFRNYAQQLGLRCDDALLRFPDRTVLLAFGTAAQMSESTALLDCIAELRRAKDPPTFFIELAALEQQEWVSEMLGRTVSPSARAPAICLLDTGVNRGHPLIRNFLSEESTLTCNPDWGPADHDGHGTEMAGIALFGDLTPQLSGSHPVQLEHRLESVKLLPPPPRKNAPDLYGALTLEAVSRAEIAAPDRARVFCMAITVPDYRDRGRPSSWSAEIDQLCAGVDGGPRRLIIVSAGNVGEEHWRRYPEYNDVAQIQDPAQAWNALTVGAFTEKGYFDPDRYPGWTLAARPGTLSPSSSTSLSWQTRWPNKPDVVLEGGNAAIDPATGDAVPLDELVLLTTHRTPAKTQFVSTWATSSATAQAARMAATLMARYPSLAPETIRALMIHSARWTSAMVDEVSRLPEGQRIRTLLRRYGYGVPDVARASWSASNALTLVAEDGLQPYDTPPGTHEVKTKDLNLHHLPWPRQALLDLADTIVELRVTLSYFVEPNPAQRGWKYRHRYQSHGLRFAMINPGELPDDFRARVTKDAQDEEQGAPSFGEPGWTVGQERTRGSVHSDFWTGTAADLAGRDHIAVFPVGGWWKERPHLRMWENRVSYSLIVSIESPKADIDIYTPVAALVGVPTAVSV